MNDDVVLPSLPSQLYIFGNNEVQFPSSDFYSSSHNKLNAHSGRGGFSNTNSNLFMEDIGGDGDDFVIPHHFLAANGQSGSSSSTTNRLDSLSSNCQTYIPSFCAVPQQSVLPSKKLKIPEFEPVISNEDRSPMEAHGLLLGGKHHIHMAGLSEFTRNTKRKTWTAEKPLQQHIQTTMESLVDKKKYKAPVIKRSQKLSDKITALQKLVSPYGKTDTASVLQEAVIYIKLLQERIKNAFESHKSSSPIFMTRPIILPQMEAEHRLSMRQGSNEINLPDDLRSRGLCLVPISMIQNLTKDDNAAASAPTSSRIGSIGY